MASHISTRLQEYLTSCTSEEISAILTTINARPTTHLAPRGMPAAKRTATRKEPGSKVSKRSISQNNKSHKIIPATTNKRPLNSWMAFRAYYSPIFTSHQQKDISGFLTTLWQSDPFKAKWSILAKAYSLIRDNKGKAAAPLDNFLTLTCPHIGIASPEIYLEILGWNVTVIGSSVSLERVAAPAAPVLDAHLQHSILSVDDIISYCRKTGYIDGDLQSHNITSKKDASTLIMAARPMHRTATSTTSSPQFFSVSINTTSHNTVSHPPSSQHTSFTSDIPPISSQGRTTTPIDDALLYAHMGSGWQDRRFPVVLANNASIPPHIPGPATTYTAPPYSTAPFATHPSQLGLDFEQVDHKQISHSHSMNDIEYRLDCYTNEDNVFLPFAQDMSSDVSVALTASMESSGDGNYLQDFGSLDIFHDDLLSDAILDPLGGDNFSAFNISGLDENSLLGNSMFWSYD